MSRVSYIEIDLLVCELSYGVAPCQAALGVTGPRKCFNTLKTCQDRDNFTPGTSTLRLATSSLDNNPDIVAIENIESVRYTPSRIALGESIGARSTLRISCREHPTPDTGPGGDPYYKERDYDPYHQGAFWAKLKARQPWLRGRTLTWYTGDTGGMLDNLERRTFVIDRVEGPDTSGRVEIVAKDPLTLTDDKRAQAPRLSRGLLSTGINASVTSLTLAPAGVGADYPASGFAAIGGNEIVSFTRSGDVMTITRGQFNTEAQEHDEDDRVQLCLRYDGEDPADILFDLLTTYGNIPESFINLENWQAETSEFLGRTYTALIAEPESVEDLVNEILEQAALSLWWDELGATMRLQVLRNVSQNSFVYSDDNIMAGSLRQRDNPAKRVSQVWTYFGQINPLESLTDPKNYRNTLATVNLQSEENHGSPAYKTIYSRWITQFARIAVERLNNLILSRYSDPPRTFSFSLLKDSGVPSPVLGGGRRVETFAVQDDTGIPVPVGTQIVELSVNDSKWDVLAEEITIDEDIDSDDPTLKIVPIDSDTNNFVLRDAFLQQYTEAQSGDVVRCEIRSGVVVGSTSVSTPAWATGTGWPAGVTLELVLFDGAIITGRGGEGGRAGATLSLVSNATATLSAENGGPGLSTEVAISVENSGVIAGGGGGGAAGAAKAVNQAGGFQAIAVVGGSGGAGFGAGGTTTVTGSRPSGYRGEDVQQRTGITGTSLGGGSGRSASASDGSGAGRAACNASGGAGGAAGEAGGSASASVTSSQGQGSSTSTGSFGQPGQAVQGDSLITWIEEGDIRGARVG